MFNNFCVRILGYPTCKYARALINMHKINESAIEHACSTSSWVQRSWSRFIVETGCFVIPESHTISFLIMLLDIKDDLVHILLLATSEYCQRSPTAIFVGYCFSFLTIEKNCAAERLLVYDFVRLFIQNIFIHKVWFFSLTSTRTISTLAVEISLSF